MWLQVKLVTGCVLCRAYWEQLDTSEALFLLVGINAENGCNKVTVVRAIWKFFWNFCVYFVKFLEFLCMSEATNDIVIAIVVVELFQTLIRRGEKPKLCKRLPK